MAYSRRAWQTDSGGIACKCPRVPARRSQRRMIMRAHGYDRGRLAIDDGSPVRENYLPYARQTVDEDDIQSVVNVLRSDWLTTGPKVEEFEQAFAAAVDAKFAISFSSG